MSKHICTSCNTEYKYASYLQRHKQKKNGCNKSINNIKEPIILPIINNENEILESNQIKTDMFSLFNIFDIFKKFIDITKQKDKEKEYFELLNNYMKDNNINQITETTIDDKKTNKDVNKQYSCDKCNNEFTSRQSMHRHNKLGRCKGIKINEQKIEEKEKSSGLTFNDIINSNIDLSESNNTSNNTIINGDHIVNNNIINNNTNNNTNNITININPFGCENLQHISIKDLLSIFKNFDQLNLILYKLSNLIYIKNNNNMNFTKNNMNKSIVTYLARDMEFKTLSEREFIKEFEKNIRKLCIELFYIHKNNLTIKELIECMKSLLLYYEMLSDTKSKLNRIELKEQLKSIMDSVFRNEEIKIILKNVEKDLLNNPALKTKCKINNVKRVKEQNKSLDEYDYKPTEDNKDEKNLNRVKDKAFTENLNDVKKYLNF
jgi:hypothetical protein